MRIINFCEWGNWYFIVRRKTFANGEIDILSWEEKLSRMKKLPLGKFSQINDFKFLAKKTFINFHEKGQNYPVAHDVWTTFLRRRFNVLTSLQRQCNIASTPCNRFIQYLEDRFFRWYKYTEVSAIIRQFTISWDTRNWSFVYSILQKI